MLPRSARTSAAVPRSCSSTYAHSSAYSGAAGSQTSFSASCVRGGSAAAYTRHSLRAEGGDGDGGGGGRCVDDAAGAPDRALYW